MLAAIDARFKKTRSALDRIASNSSDDYLTALLCQHLCIQISGNIERCIHLIFDEYARRHGDVRIRNWISNEFQRGSNYNNQRLIDALSTFDPTWGKEYKEFSEKTGIKEQLDSIYNIRTRIAHGNDTGVGVAAAREYFDAHVKLIQHICSLVIS